MTALLHAAKQGNTALGKVLVEGKADVNVKSKVNVAGSRAPEKQKSRVCHCVCVVCAWYEWAYDCTRSIHSIPPRVGGQRAGDGHLAPVRC
eukprot:g78734.t1